MPKAMKTFTASRRPRGASLVIHRSNYSSLNIVAKGKILARAKALRQTPTAIGRIFELPGRLCFYEYDRSFDLPVVASLQDVLL